MWYFADHISWTRLVFGYSCLFVCMCRTSLGVISTFTSLADDPNSDVRISNSLPQGCYHFHYVFVCSAFPTRSAASKHRLYDSHSFVLSAVNKYLLFSYPQYKPIVVLCSLDNWKYGHKIYYVILSLILSLHALYRNNVANWSWVSAETNKKEYKNIQC